MRERHPELADAIDMHLELLEVQRRVQARIPLPWLELNADILTRHQAEARPLLRFEQIPLELTDLPTCGTPDGGHHAPIRCT